MSTNNRSRRATTRLAATVITTFVALAGTSVAARAAGATTCGTSFGIVPSQNVGTSNNALFGIAALSATNAYAVGHSAIDTIYGPLDRSLVEHFDGTTWTAVASPSAPGSVTNDLYGIAARSATDIWATGFSGNTAGQAQPFAVHYNGVSWAAVPTATAGVLGAQLVGVAVVPGSPEAWTVGQQYNASNTPQTLIEHWNGVSWSVVPSPNVGPSWNKLFGVTARAANDVWAVGTSYQGTPSIGVTARTLIEHWNGASWSVVPSPNHDTIYGQDHNVLVSVTAVPGTSALIAVGDGMLDLPPVARSDQPLVEVYNGSSWQLVNEPSILPYSGGLIGVSAVSPTDIWASGEFNPGSGFDQPLLLHYDGSNWSAIPVTTVGSLNTRVFGIVATNGRVFAAGNTQTGNFTNPGPTQTLALQRCQS
jgi:hypothetical protein